MSAFVKGSCSKVFNTVSRFENYPKLLPVITESTVLSQDGNKLRVRFTFNKRSPLMQAAKSVLGEPKTTQISDVVLDPQKRTIDAFSTDGPLERFDIHFRFSPFRGDTMTKVEMTMNFATGLGKLADAAARFFMKGMADNMINDLTANLRALMNEPSPGGPSP